MIYTNYECFDLSSFISEYAKKVEKPIAFIRVWGWNHSTDVEKINKSMEIYKDILPLDMYTMMHDSEFVFVQLEDIEQTVEFFESSFPESQSKCENEMYIFYAIYNSLGQIILSNE